MSDISGNYSTDDTFYYKSNGVTQFYKFEDSIWKNDPYLYPGDGYWAKFSQSNNWILSGPMFDTIAQTKFEANVMNSFGLTQYQNVTLEHLSNNTFANDDTIYYKSNGVTQFYKYEDGVWKNNPSLHPGEGYWAKFSNQNTLLF